MLFAAFWSLLLSTLFLVTGIFLILLVLIQRGRGGGLVGALGGVGGSSPFGSRAGDIFTRITLGVAVVWVVLAVVQIYAFQPSAEDRPNRPTVGAPDAPAQ